MATHRGGRTDCVECIEIGTHVRGRQGDDEGDRGRGGNNGDKCCDVGQDEGTHRRDDDLSRGTGHLAGNRRLERRSIDGTDLLLDRQKLAQRPRLQTQIGCCGRRQHNDVDTGQGRGDEGLDGRHLGVRKIIVRGSRGLRFRDGAHVEAAQRHLAGTVDVLRVGNEDAAGIEGGDRTHHVIFVGEVSSLTQIRAIVDHVGQVQLRHGAHLVRHREGRTVVGVHRLDHGGWATRPAVPCEAIERHLRRNTALGVNGVDGRLHEVTRPLDGFGAVDGRHEDLTTLPHVGARIPAGLV